MAYFPAFIQLQDKQILLVGGGNIALEKLEKLLDFTKDIKIIALEINNTMQSLIKKHDLSAEVRAYKTGDIADFCIIIIAVDNISVQAAIFEESKNYKCLCNSVDSVEYCDFIFPSYIKEDDLTIAISTSGASPAFAKHFKRYLARLIPSNISSFLNEMKLLRKSIPKGEKRMKMLDEKAEQYIKDIKNV